MSGEGDSKAGLVIERRLAAGPADALDLLEALQRGAPGLLGRHEGGLHALLHGLLRSGRVRAGGRSARGLVLYRAPGPDAPEAEAEAEAAPADEAAWPRAARQVASGARGEADRRRIAADVAAHLAALDPQDARRGFGSPRSSRYLLHRVDRGRPAVCLAAGTSDGLRRLLLHEGPWLLAAVAVFFALKLWIVPVYRIPSRSMEPTLEVDDRVAVFLPHLGGVPERWSVITYELGGTTYVKRLVGLGGEELATLHGDVFIDGRRLVKPDAVCAALRSRVQAFDFTGGTPSGWGEPERGAAGTTWTWRGGGFPAHPAGGSGNGFLMRDGYLDLLGERGPEGTLTLTLSRGPAGGADDHALEWTLEAGPGGLALREQRFANGAPDGAAETLAQEAAAPANGRLSLSLSFVDGVLRAACGGWSWRGPREAPDAAFGVRLGARGAATAPRSLTVDRDLHYSHAGSLGVPLVGGRDPNPHRIPPGHVFCMGDNTTDSRDSRFRTPGDIPVGALIGPVHVRIWPPSRWGRVR